VRTCVRFHCQTRPGGRTATDAMATIHAKIANIGEQGLETDPIALAVSDGQGLQLLGDEEQCQWLASRAVYAFAPSDDAVWTLGRLLKRSYGSYSNVGFCGPLEVDGPFGEAARRLAKQFNLPGVHPRQSPPSPLTLPPRTPRELRVPRVPWSVSWAGTGLLTLIRTATAEPAGCQCPAGPACVRTSLRRPASARHRSEARTSLRSASDRMGITNTLPGHHCSPRGYPPGARMIMGQISLRSIRLHKPFRASQTTRRAPRPLHRTQLINRSSCTFTSI
jgi:hypothetical protein